MIFLLLFLYLYGPVFNSISPVVDFTFFVSVFLCFKSFPIKLFREKEYFIIFITLAVVGMYSVIAVSFNRRVCVPRCTRNQATNPPVSCIA